MAAEADGNDIEDKWVQSVFIICLELHKTPEEIGEMSAFSMNIFLEELINKAEREKAEAKRKQSSRFR